MAPTNSKKRAPGTQNERPKSKKQSKLDFGQKPMSDDDEFEPEAEPYEDQPSSALTISSTPAELEDENDSQLSKTKKKVRGRTSWIYKHMRDRVAIDHVFYNNSGKEEWRCKYCLQTYVIAGGTRGPMKHLEDKHRIKEDSTANTRAIRIHRSIKDAMESASLNPQNRRMLNDNEHTAIPLDGDILEVLFTRFITACSLPLRLVECPEFRSLLTYINEDVDKYLPSSHNTIGTWVLRQYEIEKAIKQQQVRNARSKVHVSCDLWTSPNTKAILVAVATYLSDNNQLEHIVMDLVEVEGTHEGSNIAKFIMPIIEDWGIVSKLGYFIMNNAGNNDTMMKELSQGMYKALNTSGIY